MMSYMAESDPRITDDLISALASTPAEGKILAHAADRREKLVEPRGDLEDYIRPHKHAAEAAAADFEDLVRDLLES